MQLVWCKEINWQASQATDSLVFCDIATCLHAQENFAVTEKWKLVEEICNFPSQTHI